MSFRLLFLLIVTFLLTGKLCGQIDTTFFPQDTVSPQPSLQDTIFNNDDDQQNRTSVKRRTSARLVTSSSETVKNKDNRTSDTLKFHSPKKAALLSLIPGGGQIYNKKWWKLPIIYAGMGASGTLAVYFGLEAVKYRNELFFRQYNATEYYNPALSAYTTPSILSDKNYFLRSMEICIGVFTILYALNIIDAVVDAHLFYFDISDELSFQIAPSIHNNTPFHTFSTGVAFKFSFR